MLSVSSSSPCSGSYGPRANLSITSSRELPVELSYCVHVKYGDRQYSGLCTERGVCVGVGVCGGGGGALGPPPFPRMLI